MRLQSLTLLAPALGPLHNFYGEVLGLAAAETADALSLTAGRTRLTFAQAPPTWAGFYHIAFNIPTNLFASAKAWLSRRVQLLHDKAGADEIHFPGWNAHALYFGDPAGNIVEFIARHDIDEPAPEPFAGRLIQGVSEIGLPADDVPALARTLSTRLGIQPYRGSASDSFTALGDEHGLFICVRRGREWFPDTGRAAVSALVTAHVVTGLGRAYTVAAGSESSVIIHEEAV